MFDKLDAVESRFGVHPERLHVERFAPRALGPVENHPVRVVLARSGLTLDVPSNQTILEAVTTAGVDVLTGGNHTLQKPEILPMLEAEPRMLRPANIAVKAPGRGVTTVETAAGPVSVVNVMGSVFLTASHSPFAIIDDLVAEARRGADVVLQTAHADQPVLAGR